MRHGDTGALLILERVKGCGDLNGGKGPSALAEPCCPPNFLFRGGMNIQNVSPFLAAQRGGGGGAGCQYTCKVGSIWLCTGMTTSRNLQRQSMQQ
eukprot:jgi/Botrbrau1/19709/Bobra.0003s0069.1